MLKYIFDFKPTTVHGLYKFIIHTGSRFSSIVWASLISFFLGVCVWESVNTINAFLEFSVKTTADFVELGNEGIPFPAITFCSTTIGLKSILGKVPPLRFAIIVDSTRVTDTNEVNKLTAMCNSGLPTNEGI